MIVLDKNQTLDRPKGFTFAFVNAKGAYLQLRFQKTVIHVNPAESNELHTVDVYLNDQGREVLRTEEKHRLPDLPPPVVAPPPQTWWEEVKSDFKFMFGRGE